MLTIGLVMLAHRSALSCVPAQPALPYRANGPHPVCCCGSAGSAVSQVPSPCWHACEGRPLLGAASARR